MPVLPKAKRRIHSLGTVRPLASAGLNFHPCAASMAFRAKYLLGPGESKVALVTLPAASTATLTLTLATLRLASFFQMALQTCPTRPPLSSEGRGIEERTGLDFGGLF